MKGGFNKIVRNIVATKGHSEFEKVLFLLVDSISAVD